MSACHLSERRSNISSAVFQLDSIVLSEATRDSEAAVCEPRDDAGWRGCVVCEHSLNYNYNSMLCLCFRYDVLCCSLLFFFVVDSLRFGGCNSRQLVDDTAATRDNERSSGYSSSADYIWHGVDELNGSDSISPSVDV